MFRDTEIPPTSPYVAYLEDSRKPVVSLYFTLPFFLLYHGGVYLMGTYSDIPWHNGADVILTKGLHYFGFAGPLVSMGLVTLFLLLWQQIEGTSWYFRSGTLGLMWLESLVLALPPFFLGALLRRVLLSHGLAPRWYENLILSLGAGVYEEFLFRVLLMGILYQLCKRLFDLQGLFLYATVVLTQAILFSLFHYLPGSTESFKLEAFAFRTLAGVYFAYIYYERGFGIAAGSHAFYDVIAVMLNAFR